MMTYSKEKVSILLAVDVKKHVPAEAVGSCCSSLEGHSRCANEWHCALSHW